MSPELQQRLVAVRAQTAQTNISLQGISDYMELHARQIQEAFDLPFGSLIRTALAIRALDCAKKLEPQHLQEAAQHLILWAEKPPRYGRSTDD